VAARRSRLVVGGGRRPGLRGRAAPGARGRGGVGVRDSPDAPPSRPRRGRALAGEPHRRPGSCLRPGPLPRRPTADRRRVVRGRGAGVPGAAHSGPLRGLGVSARQPRRHLRDADRRLDSGPGHHGGLRSWPVPDDAAAPDRGAARCDRASGPWPRTPRRSNDSGRVLAHREERLDQVRAALRTLGADATPRQIVELVYADVDKSLWTPAEWSVKAQLDYLRTLD
jgi:hypothetical protein